MDKLHCEFLHCEAEEPLIVMVEHAGRSWGLCPFHEKITSQNGITIEHERGKDYLFSPVMMRGKPD